MPDFMRIGGVTGWQRKAGKLHIPDVPGVGLEWDEKVVDAHLADNF
jgi:L-alanine-DL-glutamate epimerase-like enolase superfamily enzyme